MSGITLYKGEGRGFEHYGGPPGNAEIARLIGPETSRTMGAGVACFEDCSIPWTVLYDEVIIVLEGHFRLCSGDERYECEPGDVLWLAENTPVVYEADGKAKVFYALYPADWKKRAGL